MSSQAPSPLDGLSVVSFAQILQGPAAVQMLADFGADVIKIEPPVRGAWERHWSGANLFPAGESLFFLAFNRNQRSLTLNLKSPQGRDIACRLIEGADVVVENFRPGVMDRLGLGYEELLKRNPRLVYCASTGYGVSHPLRDKPGQDLLIQARSGIAWLNSLVQGPPHQSEAGAVDLHASLLIVLGILLALQHRQRTGRGQRVDTSLLESAIHLQTELLTYAMNGWNYNAGPIHDQPYGIYQTKDGYLALGHAVLKDLTELLNEPRLAEILESERFLRGPQIRTLVQAKLLTRTVHEWLQILEPAGIWCAPVSSYDDVLAPDGVLTPDNCWHFEHPVAGNITTVAPPISLSESPAQLRRVPPSLGEHTCEILTELSFDSDEIEAMREAGVV